MKKILLLLLTAIFTLPAFSQEFSYEGLGFRILDESKCELTGLSGYSGDGRLVIPETVVYNAKNYQVTSIGQSAFWYCSSLTSIDIPNSVTEIGYYAFGYCTSLTSIDIPNSVTSIGDYAFYGCSSLTSITVQDGNKNYSSIEGVLFDSYRKILIVYPCGKTDSTYQIPNSVTSIGYCAFEWCSSLTSIDIPNSVTSIGHSAFGWCDSLTSIDIPNSVTSIGESAFQNCSSLTSIDIPNSVTSIGQSAFWNCSSLTSIDIPNSVTEIGQGAFSCCFNIT